MLNVLVVDSYVTWSAGTLISDVMSTPFKDLARGIRKQNQRVDCGVINSESLAFSPIGISFSMDEKYNSQLIEAIQKCRLDETLFPNCNKIEIPKRAKFLGGAWGWGTENSLVKFLADSDLNYLNHQKPKCFIAYRFFY